MDAYQELLSERNKLAAQVAAQAVEINALEQSTAVRIGKRLKRFAPVLHQALRVARLVRRLRNKLRRPMRVAHGMASAKGENDQRATVILLAHEATNTPRSLLTLALMRELRASYRVVAVLLGAGPLLKDFAEAADIVLGPYAIGQDDFSAGTATAEGIAAGYGPRFAIACGAETRHIATPLSTAGVPLIALMHELPMALAHPNSTTRGLLDRADDIVFSCRPVEDLYGPFYGRLDYRRTHVIAPGQYSPDVVAITSRLRDRLAYIPLDTFVVLGQGTVEYRSGVDVFIATASAWRSAEPQAKFHFVWTGKGPDKDYAIYIDEQIARAGIGDSLSLLFEGDDSQVVYDDVDLVYATARLDYLPGVAVAYALAGIPVVSFANAGGIAEIFAADPATARLVLPHMDSAAAVTLLNALAMDKALLRHLGAAARDRAQKACDISAYTKQLIALGEDAARARSERPATVQVLAEPGNFDIPLYTGKSEGMAAKIIAGYLERSYYDGFRKRALVGFHPELYASQTPDFKALRLDPLTHYLKAGRPTGPWLHQVIRLDASNKSSPSAARIAIQGHFYYVDHIGVLLKALAANRSRADLFLTTGSEANRKHLLQATRSYAKGSVTVEIVPNKGRDIGPFLHHFRETLHDAYDFIGHVHGKRSVHTAKWDPNLGERWRNFLFQHLLGPKAAAMDAILAAFESDPTLGLVFPEDRNVIGWDYDFEHAQRLAERMGFTTTLPKHIDFPIGTMFWARSAALRPLLRLDLAWAEYPDEPLPVDGTILHALERLIPSIACEAGYDYATTHFPGISY